MAEKLLAAAPVATLLFVVSAVHVMIAMALAWRRSRRAPNLAPFAMMLAAGYCLCLAAGTQSSYAIASIYPYVSGIVSVSAAVWASHAVAVARRRPQVPGPAD